MLLRISDARRSGPTLDLLFVLETTPLHTTTNKQITTVAMR